jgi:hypothetical protein
MPQGERVVYSTSERKNIEGEGNELYLFFWVSTQSGLVA